MAVVALASLVFPLLGVARLLPWAVAVLAGSVLVASEHGDVGSVGVALCAALVLLVGECASAAGNLAPLTGIERRLARRLVVRIAAETVAAAALAAVVLAVGVARRPCRPRHARARAPGDGVAARARPSVVPVDGRGRAPVSPSPVAVVRAPSPVRHPRPHPPEGLRMLFEPLGRLRERRRPRRAVEGRGRVRAADSTRRDRRPARGADHGSGRSDWRSCAGSRARTGNRVSVVTPPGHPIG